MLYDYTFRAPGTHAEDESLRKAYDAGVVCTDEMLLHPDPCPNRESWCADRVAYTEGRLAAIDPALPTVLLSHWPLVRQPTDVLWHPEFVVVRHRVDRRLACALPGRGGGLRAPVHPAHDALRRGAVRGGVARLSPEWGARAGPPQLLLRILNGAG